MIELPRTEPHFSPDRWTIPAVLEHQASVRGDAPFLQWTDACEPLTFSQVNRCTNQLARGLASAGVRRGDKVVILMPNSIEFVLAWFAINKLGAVQVPLNTAYMGSFLEHQVNVCDAATVVVSMRHAENLLRSLPKLDKVKRLVFVADGGAPYELPELAGELSTHRFEALFEADDTNLGIHVEPSEIGAVLFTSGTTGLSKGVLMPHAHFYLFSELMAQLVQLKPDDVYATWFPLFHGNAQFCTLAPCLIAGARCVLWEKFSASQWSERLARSGATIVNSIGATMDFLLAQPPTAWDREHRLRVLFASPSPSQATLAAFKKRFGEVEFRMTFGQTEANMPIMTPPGVKVPEYACGVAVDQWFELRLVDPETDIEVPEGAVGEMVVRPRHPWTINAGYINMPQQTLSAWRNLWFHTGDGLRRDRDGWYYFVDRIKDSIRRRGENISSFEVEAPIAEHPAVKAVAVIPVPADGGAASEDEVKACIVLKQGADATYEELLEWCKSRIPTFAVPRYIEIMSELPMTPTERIQKNKLKAAGINPQTWDATTGRMATGSSSVTARAAAQAFTNT